MEDNTLDQNLYTTAMKEALKVEFLESNEELNYMPPRCIMRWYGVEIIRLK